MTEDKTFEIRRNPLYVINVPEGKFATPPSATEFKNVYSFDPELAIEGCVKWIRDWYNKVAGEKSDNRVIIGMSGGKDSTICAALLVKALGKKRVVGVSLPEHRSNDLAMEICNYLGIESIEIIIGQAVHDIKTSTSYKVDVTPNAETNIPPRIRMTYLYAIAQSLSGYVVNTCNLSEDYIGYSTIFGDLAGAFSPLAKFTVTELRMMGHELGLPPIWVNKTPSDDLPNSCGDEEKFGFSYEELDKYIRTGSEPKGFDGKCVKGAIEEMHNKNKFKLDIVRIPAYDPETEIK